jgi:hypothetical protein
VFTPFLLDLSWDAGGHKAPSLPYTAPAPTDRRAYKGLIPTQPRPYGEQVNDLFGL